jgi:hypothetical protein
VKAKRPSHPASNVRDDRDTPLLWKQDARRRATDLPDGASEISAREWVDGAKGFERKAKLAFLRTRIRAQNRGQVADQIGGSHNCIDLDQRKACSRVARHVV